MAKKEEILDAAKKVAVKAAEAKLRHKIPEGNVL